MSELVSSVEATLPSRRRGFVFLNPYVQLGVGALLVTASELMLKKGADATAGQLTGIWARFGIAALASLWTWGGILTYLLSFASWIYVLRFVPLGIAFAAINVVHVTVPLGCYFLLHEHVPLKRWIGVGLVLCGLLLILQQVVKVESKR